MNFTCPPSASITTISPSPTASPISVTEFIAFFLSWYAFLLLICCVVPTVVAIRRRSTRNIRENTSRGHHGNGDADRLDGREILETLFETTAGNHRLERRRTSILVDILNRMSVRALVEREERKRREKSTRLVTLLKETSMEVKQCHLIPCRPNDEYDEQQCGNHIIEIERDVNAQVPSRSYIEGKESLDGNKNSKQRHESTILMKQDSHCVSDTIIITPPQCDMTNNDDTSDKPTEKKSSDRAESQIQTRCTNALFSTSDQQIETVSQQSIKGSNRSYGELTSALKTKSVESSDTNSSHLSTSRSTTDQLAVNSIPTSGYQVLDPYIDDYDDDIPYRALRVPCANTESTSMTVDVTDEQSRSPSTVFNETRLVPPKCAICLIHYEAGCYITWSSNQECIHVFHRDCILMWLLTKDEPMCPCCRGAFILSQVGRRGEQQEMTTETDSV